MTLVAVASWRGLGATTSSLLLASGAAAAGHPSWLVEADPAGGVLNARIPDLRAESGTSVESVAFDPDEADGLGLLRSSFRPFGSTRVLTLAPDSFQAWSALSSPRRDWIGDLRRLDGVVVVDVGSLRGGLLPSWRIVEQADALVLCTTPDPASLVSTTQWIETKGQSAPGVVGLAADTSKLLVVDAPVTAGERFGPAVAGELGDRVVGWWPWEPRTVDAVHRGASLDHRSLRRSTLARAVLATIASLAGPPPEAPDEPESATPVVPPPPLGHARAAAPAPPTPTPSAAPSTSTPPAAPGVPPPPIGHSRAVARDSRSDAGPDAGEEPSA